MLSVLHCCTTAGSQGRNQPTREHHCRTHDVTSEVDFEQRVRDRPVQPHMVRGNRERNAAIVVLGFKNRERHRRTRCTTCLSDTALVWVRPIAVEVR